MKNKLLIITIALLAVACGEQGGDNNLAKKKEELEKARASVAELKNKIATLEKEISEADPEFAKQISKAILVSVFKAEKKPFEHKMDVRGAIESRTNVLLGSSTGGEIKQVLVREGQQVSRGQVLVVLDGDVIRNTIGELKTSLELATQVYEKQARLWEQKIGTELQYLQAKNNKESLEKRLATANAQLEQTIIRAPFSGRVDQLPARVGEMAAPGIYLVRMTSPEDMYIKADVSERYIGKFKAGDKVDIVFPILSKSIQSTISAVGQVINPENRTFEIEVRLPKTDFQLSPNQVVILQLRDYVSLNALAVPTRIIQKDEDGQFIFAVDNRGETLLARKVRVVTGIISGNETEIVEGLNGEESIVDLGYRELTEGVEVKISNAGDSTSAKVAKN